MRGASPFVNPFTICSREDAAGPHISRWRISQSARVASPACSQRQPGTTSQFLVPALRCSHKSTPSGPCLSACRDSGPPHPSSVKTARLGRRRAHSRQVAASWQQGGSVARYASERHGGGGAGQRPCDSATRATGTAGAVDVGASPRERRAKRPTRRRLGGASSQAGSSTAAAVLGRLAPEQLLNVRARSAQSGAQWVDAKGSE